MHGCAGSRRTAGVLEAEKSFKIGQVFWPGTHFPQFRRMIAATIADDEVRFAQSLALIVAVIVNRSEACLARACSKRGSGNCDAVTRGHGGSSGVVECWSNGEREARSASSPNTPPLRHSTTPRIPAISEPKQPRGLFEWGQARMALSNVTSFMCKFYGVPCEGHSSVSA